MSLNGFASKKATQILSEKHKELSYSKLGKTVLFVSEVGFSGTNLDIRSPLNRDALKKALLSGVNLIDTSASYTDGNSETLIGEVLSEIINADLLSRESIVIITKGGCIQGEDLVFSQERKQENFPFPDVIQYKEDFEYCIHPEFLEYQIQQSLERLQIKTIDIYLLQNPEYYLKWAQNNNINMQEAKTKLYSKIKKSFEYLEKEVTKGRIKNYGISSSTFSSSIDSFEFISLEKIISLAEEISSENHFSVIEFPMNFIEKDAVLIKNQPDNLTLIDFASNKNLGIITNRPLSSTVNNKTIKFAKPIVPVIPTKEAINAEFDNIHKIEEIIFNKLKLLKNDEILSEITGNLFVYKELNNNWDKFEDSYSWKIKLNQYYLPKFHYYKNYIKNNSLKNEELEMDLFSCTFKIGKIFSLISAYWDSEYSIFTDKIVTQLQESAPDLATANKLSNMAIRALRSTKGITSVLVGMTQVPYVSDAVSELKNPVNKNFDWDKINLLFD